MNHLIVALIVAIGASLIAGGVIMRGRERQEALKDALDLPWFEHDRLRDDAEGRPALVSHTVTLASRVVEQFDAKGSLRQALERARLPLRPGEYALLVAAGTAGLAMTLWLGSGQVWFVVLSLAFGPIGGSLFLKYRIRRRRRQFEAQLPDALSLIAGSLTAGHTFLRAVQMLCEEAEPPMSEEFSRVVYETQLGDPVVDALERMAVRLEVRDLEWVVQAIRVQETVGGKLADLLHTLADFIRAREEVRREVNVLTAEGRVSAWVLGALPFVILVVISAGDPQYMRPMYRGWGYVWLAGTALSVVVGMIVILNMVRKIEV